MTSLTKGTLRLTCKWLNNLSTLVRYIVERKQWSFSHMSWQLRISEISVCKPIFIFSSTTYWNVIHQLYPAGNTEIYAIAQYLICLHNLMCYSTNFIQKCAFRFNNFYIINTNSTSLHMQGGGRIYVDASVDGTDFWNVIFPHKSRISRSSLLLSQNTVKFCFI